MIRFNKALWYYLTKLLLDTPLYLLFCLCYNNYLHFFTALFILLLPHFSLSLKTCYISLLRLKKKYPRLGDLNSRNLFPQSRGWKFKIEVSAGLISPEGLFPWLVHGHLLPMFHMIFHLFMYYILISSS